MNSVADFLEMGGYAAFVWPSFAATAIVMAVTLVASLRTLKANQATLDSLQSQTAPRKGPATQEAADEAQA